MKIRNIYLISFILTFLLQLNLYGQKIDSIKFVNTKNEYFKLISENNFEKASTLFHYPPSYTKTDLENDQSAVSKILKLFSSEFGNFQPYDTLNNNSETRYASIDGVDIPYWSKYPKTINITYPVKFNKEGFGYITFRYCFINNGWELRDTSYALPISRKDAASRIQEISMKMMMAIQGN